MGGHAGDNGVAGDGGGNGDGGDDGGVDNGGGDGVLDFGHQVVQVGHCVPANPILVISWPRAVLLQRILFSGFQETVTLLKYCFGYSEKCRHCHLKPEGQQHPMLWSQSFAKSRWSSSASPRTNHPGAQEV